MTSQIEGALLGQIVGDALAMPAHWYYGQEVLRELLGEVAEMRQPTQKHPDSFLGRPYNGSRDILHDKAPLYGGAAPSGKPLVDSHGDAIIVEGADPGRGIHYHATLTKGQNTTNVCIARLLMRYLGKTSPDDPYDGYDPVAFCSELERYMTTPPPENAKDVDPGQVVNHNDCHLDKYLVFWFERRDSLGPLQAASRQRDDWSIGSLDGVVLTLPLILTKLGDPEGILVAKAIEHAKLTHDSISVFAVLAALVPLFQQIVSGEDPDAALRAAGRKLRMPKITGEELKKSYNEAKGPGNIPKGPKWAQHNVFAPETITEALLEGPDPLVHKEPLAVCGSQAGMGKRLAITCYCEHSIAVVLYLALKYGDDYETALKANVAIGGHSTSRGAVLGAIIGARIGRERVPSRWVQDLASPETVDGDVRAAAAVASLPQRASVM